MHILEKVHSILSINLIRARTSTSEWPKCCVTQLCDLVRYNSPAWLSRRVNRFSSVGRQSRDVCVTGVSAATSEQSAVARPSVHVGAEPGLVAPPLLSRCCCRPSAVGGGGGGCSGAVAARRGARRPPDGSGVRSAEPSAEVSWAPGRPVSVGCGRWRPESVCGGCDGGGLTVPWPRSGRRATSPSRCCRSSGRRWPSVSRPRAAVDQAPIKCHILSMHNMYF